MNAHNDSIPAAPGGIVELSDDFLAEMSGGNILGDLWNGIKAVGHVVGKAFTAVGKGLVAVVKGASRIHLGGGVGGVSIGVSL